MIIQQQPHLRSFGGSWEDWCGTRFASDPVNLGKCNSKPMGLLTTPPWTTVGAIQRGIPKPGDPVASIFVPDPTETLEAETDPGAGTGGSGSGVTNLFGIPEKILWVGGGVLAVGLVVLLATRKKRGGAVAGYRRRKSRRARRN